nr:MAG TPA: hypothetical protein [Caudoviricetes sp.]
MLSSFYHSVEQRRIRCAFFILTPTAGGNGGTTAPSG